MAAGVLVGGVLRAEVAGPGASVGVCVPRSPETLVALLGSLKCGATFVPLDGDWPDERFGHVVKDAGCTVVLSDRPEQLAERLDAVEALALDGRTLPADDSNPPCASTAEITALVGGQDPHVPAADSPGWSRHTSAPVQTGVLPGDHYYLLDNHPEIIARISSSLVP
ncbi:AMP-binding protein [Kribbella sp. NPDC050470]|uniref:AMP-binding protein n=1 Tax=unclassified Kribbella TaxID=2644121 RepID=UPI00378C8FAD